MDQPPDWSSSCLSIIEHAPLPMVMVEGARHVVRCVNPLFCRLIDGSRDELAGKPLAEVVPGQDEFMGSVDRVLRTGKPEGHVELHRLEPRPSFRACSMWPVMAGERPVGVMIQVTETAEFRATTLAMNEALLLGSVRQHQLTEASDSLNARLHVEIGERRLVEESLNRAQAQLSDRAGQLEGMVAERTSELTAANRQLEAFVYSIAHDLRAPLRAMQGFSTLLLEEAGASLSEAGKDYAGRINSSAQFMDAMLRDLLAFSRINQQRVELTPVSLKTVVGSVLSRLQEDIQETNARVESAESWPVVLAHEPTLAQVLFNLVSNALKFVSTDAPTVIRLRSEERGQFIRVWVEDNGIGIAPDHQGQIFRLFTRLDGEKYAGTGLGLAIVQKGVERMGGRVGVESTPGHGSRFWFELRNSDAAA